MTYLIKDHKTLSDMHQILINCSIQTILFFESFSFYSEIARSKYKANKKSHQIFKAYSSRQKRHGPALMKVWQMMWCATMHSGGTSGKPKIIELQNRALNILSTSLEQMYTRKQRGGGEASSVWWLCLCSTPTGLELRFTPV